MSSQENSSPASVAALSRTYKDESLRNACIVLVTWELFYSKAEQIYYTGGEIFDIVKSAQQIMERASKPEAHIGRANAGQQLSSLVEHGLLSRDDAHWLRYVAKLVAREDNPKIDPLFEVCRRVLALKLADEGRPS